MLNPPQSKRWRILRRCLVGLGVCVTLIGLFHTEELWRGKRAWENCKRDLQAKGVDLNWAHYIPAPVPENENVFGVPEMQEWFPGRHGGTELSKKLSYPAFESLIWTNRMAVAEVRIGLSETPAPGGSVALRWDDPTSRTEAASLLTNALGPTANAPQSPMGIGFMLRRPEEIRVAQIFLQCQTAPTKKELQGFLPNRVLDDPLDLESEGNNSYRVTVPKLVTVADYLAWSEQFEPQFALIRQALQRSSLRMEGNYEEPFEIPIPNFITIRTFAQTMGARAQCHFLLGQKEEALRDLTLLHVSCRLMADTKPMTLVAAMINVAVRGLYASTIADGLRSQGWREPQLAALEEQLKQINLLPPVRQAFEIQRVAFCHFLETATAARVGELCFNDIDPHNTNSWSELKESILGGLIPRGWVYQNMVAIDSFYPYVIAGWDPASQIVVPNKVNDLPKQFESLFPRRSPYNFTAFEIIPNFTRTFQVTAEDQTKVNQAFTACALERYHLAHGEYPETLDALIPQFIDKIPHDVIGGQPPHYRRAADGTFLLYSIGWNGRDNGGVRGKSNTDGDWVWP